MPESLTIDFGDREDIRAKLPAARQMLEQKDRAASEALADYHEWRDFVRMLERRAALSEDESPEAGKEQTGTKEHERDEPAEIADGAQPLDLVVEVVNRENRAIRAKTVTEILRGEGHHLTPVTVSNALFYAAKRAKPRRVKQTGRRGFYAPLTFQEEPGPSSATDSEQSRDSLPNGTNPFVGSASGSRAD